MATARAEPVGGKFLTPLFKVLLVVWALGTAAGIARFALGLGAVTAMNDGYPWGIWIAIDVVVGTALGSGGFAVALLVYVLNRGRFHPLVRPALLTSALGYTAGATAIVFDVGRYWNLWRVPVAPLVSGGRFGWNWNSGLLEVALCVMAYTAVLWIEAAPPVLETYRDGRPGPLRVLASAALSGLEKALPVVLALGLVLPMMHQSTLGSLFLVATTKLHPLWHTPLLPLLFLLSCVGMGYAAVMVEAGLSAHAFRRQLETSLLADLTGLMAAIAALLAVVRLLDVALRGRLPLAFALDRHAVLFWVEIGLAGAAAVLLWRRRHGARPGALVRSAAVLAAAGGLYRVDVYLTAFDPGNGWRYFPSVGELLVTFAILSVETTVFVFFVKKFPILPAARRPAAPAPAAREAS
ncbi:MAG TPA: Ni/Fe-hydrogenase cytochrome b subunit [Anaeromyxobacteraceae bacterium]|jgi:Ni/Fe-hydrogenase subunit HybB-like protein|nr:Ni/Fe-hydrogenase cytochrome b subunit [Anaeromyxobacteraceae bacterium]